MTKRLFLKLIALLPVGGALGFSNRPREYLAAVRWEEVVGLRFEWPSHHAVANEFPGRDWEIFQKCQDPFVFEGMTASNHRRNKFLVRPVGVSDRYKLLLLDPLRCGNHTDWSMADLSFARCYHP